MSYQADHINSMEVKYFFLIDPVCSHGIGVRRGDRLHPKAFLADLSDVSYRVSEKPYGLHITIGGHKTRLQEDKIWISLDRKFAAGWSYCYATLVEMKKKATELTHPSVPQELCP